MPRSPQCRIASSPPWTEPAYSHGGRYVMKISELAALKLSGAIVSISARLWLTDFIAERHVSIEEIIKRNVPGYLEQRRALRFVDRAIDLLAERILSTSALEFPSLAQNEKDAAALSIADAFDPTSIPEDFARGDVDVTIIERYIHTVLDSKEGDLLSPDGMQFRRYLIREASAWLVSIVNTLPALSVNTFNELLQREEQILDQVEKVLERLPEHSVITPDEEFELDYKRMTVIRLDKMELFGVRLDSADRTYPLSPAYVPLTVISDGLPSRAGDLLGQTQKLFLLGNAGTGKSTFMRWIAVNAARRSFDPDLGKFNSLVPFFIPLRRWAETALPAPDEFISAIGPAMAGLAPIGWVHRVLSDGRACVLVDGIDEVSFDRLPEIASWLNDLAESFPRARYIVTSRPSTDQLNQFQRPGFTDATLQPMLQTDVRAFIALWHEAAAINRGDDARVHDYDLYRRQLIEVITQSSELRELATNPLLCALLCALNLRSRIQLPVDKVRFYETAIEMLLERRDAERMINTYRVHLSFREKLLILRDLAYWLIRNNRVYISRDQAVIRIEDKLRSFNGNAVPDAVFADLIQRSGLLHESSVDEVGFLHLSFQEYLAAEEAVLSNDIGFLVESAASERYRNVIVLAAAQANTLQRRQLILGIIGQGDERPELKRYLILLALSCAGNAPELDTTVAQMLRARTLEVLPPRSKTEENMLADAGAIALAWLQAT
jgi:hypothetical protein